MIPAGVVPQGRLTCSDGLVIRVRSDGECEVDAPLGRVRLGPQTLPVLGIFARPCTVAEANALLAERVGGKRDAIELFATIAELCRVGALAPEGELPAFAPDAQHEGFGSVPIHVAMLDDRARTQGWLAAIAREVKADDVVLDIGTGTGVLAVRAAMAGARHVYAVEASGATAAAVALAQANGVAERVTVLRGWSGAIELPERATLLVCEILDDDPFCEGVLEVAADARARLLTSDARILPSRVSLFAALVEIPEKTRNRHAFTDDNTTRWHSEHGIDFGSLRNAFGAGFVCGVRKSEAREFVRLCAPVRIVDAEVGGSVQRIDTCRRASITRAGELHGIVSWFEAELAGQSVTTDPVSHVGATHWFNPTLFSATPRRVEEGEQIGVRYRYPGSPAWELVA